MRRRLILAYQILTGLSDSVTGVLLIMAPALTLRLMRLEAPAAALPYLSYVGVFVLSTGLACFYGAIIRHDRAKLETVWLLTALTRALVAFFIVANVCSGALAAGWITVAVTDAFFAMVQAIGLAKGWVRHGVD